MGIRARIGGVWATVVVDTENTGVSMGEKFAGKLGRDQVFAVKEGYGNRINVTNGCRGFGRLRGATIARRQRRSCEAIKVRRGNNTFVTMGRGQW